MKEEIKQRIELIKNGQVPQGYKTTKVGIIPEDWEITTLQRLGDFKKGKEVCGNNIIDSGLPAMMYGDIYVKYNIKFYNVDYRISEETAKKSTPVYKNDLLFTCSGETALEIGKCVCYLGDETIYIGGDILAFTPYNCNSLFIAYQQNLFDMIKEKARYGQGHSVVHIYLNSISKLSVFLPPLKEQQKIADILTTQDKLIELKQKLIEEKEKQKKYLMQNLLTGKIRLKGFNDKWEKVKLGDIVPLRNGFAFKSDNFIDFGIPIIKISNILNTGKIGGKFDYYIEQENDKDYLLPNNAVILAMSGATTGKVSILKNENNKKYYQNQRVGYFVDNNKVNYVFISFIIRSNMFMDKIKNILVSGAQPNISTNDVNNFIFYIPKSLQEQNAIAEILSKADEEIELLKRDLEQEKEKKKSLMQLLLTGIVRV